jgi:hypothetical protein
MKRTGWITVLAALALLGGCNNFFHELIPPDENRILSFRVKNQLGEAEIGENRITAVVDRGTGIDALIPEIRVSAKATVLPLTMNYIAAAFPSANILQEAMAFYTAADLSAYVIGLIGRNPDFAVPVLDRPIDFSGPVDFLVLSGQGNIRRYTVSVSVDTGDAKILDFGFSKYYNPELIRDSFAEVNEDTKTILAYVLYPAEYEAGFALIPGFEVFGDRLTAEDQDIRSGIDAILFENSWGWQNKSVRVDREGCPSTSYTLRVLFSKDPDSVRSITDFRFTKGDNSGLVLDAVAAIINTEDRGTIRVQVLYTGFRPSSLIPRFICPGTVSAGGVSQTSGSSAHGFDSPLEYTVVSRNGLYIRTYTVEVEFVNITGSMPRISSFRFSYALNPVLTQDTEGEINEGAGRILIDAHYGSSFAPDSLSPEFTASGMVTVAGMAQTSGLSSQNFSRQVKYTVVSPDNPALTKDYWVEVRFVQDPGASAAITAFSFHPDENPGLADELAGRIDPGTGQIFIYTPYGLDPAGLSAPRFSASGKVSVAGNLQTSGHSSQSFNGPVVYEVESPNGMNRRTYTVRVLEIARIYVKEDAAGNNSGVSWNNAFTSLKAACDFAFTMPQDLAKEVWIAAGTYHPSNTGDTYAFFPISSNTSYTGGFAGWETGKEQRNPAANPVILSGDLGGGLRSRSLFKNSDTVHGDIVFEDLAFTKAGTLEASSVSELNSSGGGIALVGVIGPIPGRAEIRNCVFTDLESPQHGGAVNIQYPALIVSGMVIKNTTARFYGGGACFSITGDSPVLLEGIHMEGTKSPYGGGLYLQRYPASGITTVTLRDSEFKNCRSGELYNNAIYEGHYGAFYINSYNVGDKVYITNTDFINCSAGRNYQIGAIFAKDIAIKGCNFINDSGVYPYPAYAYSDDFSSVVGHLVFVRPINSPDVPGTAIIEDCAFTNLVNTYTAKKVYAVTTARQEGVAVGETFFLTVKNTQFNSRSDMNLGFIQTRSGFLLDNCRIQYAPSQSPPMPLFCIKYAACAYAIKTNNTYNGAPLDAAAVAAMNADAELVEKIDGAVLSSVP